MKLYFEMHFNLKNKTILRKNKTPGAVTFVLLISSCHNSVLVFYKENACSFLYYFIILIFSTYQFLFICKNFVTKYLNKNNKIKQIIIIYYE